MNLSADRLSKGVSTASATSNSGGYGAFPQPPRMGFLTLSADF